MSKQLLAFKVTDKKSFAVFVDLLNRDLLENPENWENKDLTYFLEALSRYTEDIQGYYDNTNQNIDTNKPTWQLFADILKGASIYE